MRRGGEGCGQAGGSSPAEKEGVEKKAGDGALVIGDRRRESWRVPSPQRDAVGPWGLGQAIGLYRRKGSDEVAAQQMVSRSPHLFASRRCLGRPSRRSSSERQKAESREG